MSGYNTVQNMIGSAALEFVDTNCIKVAVDDSGWDTLYKNSDDNEYWHLSYPNSEMHGGGEPSLKSISYSKAKELFDV